MTPGKVSVHVANRELSVAMISHLVYVVVFCDSRRELLLERRNSHGA
jgi:hypothetical protein